MKLVPHTKYEQINTAISEKLGSNFMASNSIFFSFLFLNQFGAISKPDSSSIQYNAINSVSAMLFPY